MSRMFRIFMVAAALLSIAAPGVTAQQAEREFGWSLTVDPGAKRSKRVSAAVPPALRPPPSDGEIVVETDLVLSDVLVQDRNGVPVSGLIASDFEITENGTPQKIDVFTFGDSGIPRSIILVIDHSLSQWKHIDRSVAAAKILVDSLRPADRMAIVSDDVALISDFTSDKGLLKERLESLKQKCAEGRFGRSFQYSALYASINERISRNGSRNIVIFQTDGDELATLRSTLSWGSKKFGIDDIVSAAVRKGVTIYSVFTGSRFKGLSRDEMVEKIRSDLLAQMNEFPANAGHADPARPFKPSSDFLEARARRMLAEEAIVASVAKRSGGIAQSLDSPDEAAAVYERILSDVARRYLVGYYPPGRTEGEPREREVRIALRNKGNYRIVGGRTYVAY